MCSNSQIFSVLTPAGFTEPRVIEKLQNDQLTNRNYIVFIIGAFLFLSLFRIERIASLRVDIRISSSLSIVTFGGFEEPIPEGARSVIGSQFGNCLSGLECVGKAPESIIWNCYHSRVTPIPFSPSEPCAFPTDS